MSILESVWRLTEASQFLLQYQTKIDLSGREQVQEGALLPEGSEILKIFRCTVPLHSGPLIGKKCRIFLRMFCLLEEEQLSLAKHTTNISARHPGLPSVIYCLAPPLTHSPSPSLWLVSPSLCWPLIGHHRLRLRHQKMEEGDFPSEEINKEVEN